MNYIDLKNFRKYEQLYGDNGPAKIGHINYVIKNTNEDVEDLQNQINNLPVGVSQITAGSNVTINPVGGTGNVTINAVNNGVTQIVAGTNISLNPTSGLGAVTISAIGGPAPSVVGNVVYVYNETDLVNAVSGHSTGTVNYICMMNNIGLTSSINLPKTTTSWSKQLHINLMGNTLYDNSVGGLPYLIGRIPIDQNEALNVMQSWAFILENGSLRGKGNGITGTLLDLGATYNSVVRKLRLENATRGIYFRFCLMGRVEHVTTLNIGEESVYLDKGNWTGATNSNSQSNHTKIESCRVYNIGNNFAAYRVQASSGVEIANSISEGLAPQHHVYFNSENSPVVKDFKIKVFHIESSSTTAGIYVRIAGGFADINSVFSQYVNNLFVAESSSGSVNMIIRNVPWLPVGTKFRGIGNTKWVFTDIYDGGNLFNAATYWVSSTLPNAGQSVYWNGNTRATVNI
jgi:hypothetical protein